jgi:hypothetical protein
MTPAPVVADARNPSQPDERRSARKPHILPEMRSSTAERPSLIDDADFLAELDKMENGPKDLEGDARSASWEQALEADATDDAPLPRARPERPAAAPEPPPVRRAAPAKAQPAKPARPERPLRLDPPARPAATVRPNAPDRPERPARPARPVHVDEIGTREQRMDAVDAVASGLEPRRIPAALAALTVVLCLGVGAGSAALVFHDRVAQIVVTWAK